jgi:NAD(P)H-flavin reductase/ferredoxin
MTTVVFETTAVDCAEGESLLDALLRDGHDIPNGCRSGVCQSCLLRSDTDEPIAAAQSGLSDAQKQLNYFLSCQCIPKEPMTVQRADASNSRVVAHVVAKEALNSRVILLRLQADMHYQAGQYVTLWKDQSLARSYSLASLPNDDGLIDLHIRQYPNGQFSSWVNDEVAMGDTIEVQGPLGQCIYTPCSEQSILLAAIGTGLAPIWGVLQDALKHNHHGSIDVVVAAQYATDFYLLDQLQQCVDQHPNVSLHLVCLHEAESCDDVEITQGDVYQYCSQHFSTLAGYKVFLCGAQSFVTKLRKQCFLSGASMADIATDSFIPFST